MKLLCEMTEPELRELGIRLGRTIEDMLPPGPSNNGKCLFAVIYTDTTEPGVGQYLANIRREDCIKMLRETADRLERREDVTR